MQNLAIRLLLKYNYNTGFCDPNASACYLQVSRDPPVDNPCFKACPICYHIIRLITLRDICVLLFSIAGQS